MKTAQDYRNEATNKLKEIEDFSIKSQLEGIIKCIEGDVNFGKFQTAFYLHDKMYEINKTHLHNLGFELEEEINTNERYQIRYIIKW